MSFESRAQKECFRPIQGFDEVVSLAQRSQSNHNPGQGPPMAEAFRDNVVVNSSESINFRNDAARKHVLLDNILLRPRGSPFGTVHSSD